jgi:phosphocarrier protein HPr
MFKTQKVVRNKHGLHARPAALIATKAGRFKSMITIGHGPKSVNAKSVLGVMLLGARQGTTMTIQADGEDELLAIESISGLFDEAFGEF